MAKHRPNRISLISSIGKTLRKEWGAWLIIAILFLVALIFSNQLAASLKDSTFIQLLDSLSKLGLLVALIAFLREIPKWRERIREEAKKRQFEYWKAIDAAYNAREASPDGRFTSYALKIALESLAEEIDSDGNPVRFYNIDLSGVNFENGIKLSKVDLSLSIFRYANLSNADLSQTILYKVTFARARLFGTNFSGAKFGTNERKDLIRR